MKTTANPISESGPEPLASQVQVAQQVFHELLRGFSTADLPTVMACFAEGAVIEYPYAPQVGPPARLQGKAAIEQYLRVALGMMPGLTFTSPRFAHDLTQQVHWVEVHGEAPVAATGRTYQQDYVMRFEMSDGKIQHYREYWNLPAFQAAFAGDSSLDAAFNQAAQSA